MLFIFTERKMCAEEKFLSTQQIKLYYQNNQTIFLNLIHPTTF